jgi:hypothetical protein
VQPATVIRWHRLGFRLFWRLRSRPTGRPSTKADLRVLIRRIASENPGWGAPRIHGELLKLGVAVAQSTVAKYMPHRNKPPSQTWRTFLQNHMNCAAGIDFFAGREAAYGVLFGGIREALRRIGEGHVPAGYGDQVAEICLRALQADPRRIAAVLAHELPEMARSAVGRRP